ncbi:MAG: hypothetical protein JWM39_581 [Parcubacteria group bacterium]|jgi:hypothetical protein|nr:hypothetical protein [Parcubacteria group bacterium]
MKTPYVIGLIIVLVLIAGGVYAWMKNNAASIPATTQAVSSTTMPTGMDISGTAAPAMVQANVTIGATPVPSAGTPAAMHFVVNGNDATADLKTITVKKGTPVSITFGADAGTTYHGGLDYRSATLSTGTITPGSTKMVSFTAASNMTFTPYWPATNIAKPYTINVIVD